MDFTCSIGTVVLVEIVESVRMSWVRCSMTVLVIWPMRSAEIFDVCEEICEREAGIVLFICETIASTDLMSSCLCCACSVDEVDAVASIDFAKVSFLDDARVKSSVRTFRYFSRSEVVVAASGF